MRTRTALSLSGCGLAALIFNLAVGCSPTPPPPAVIPPATEEPASSDPSRTWFQDVTADAGIGFTYRNGEEANHYAIIESLGGGVALFDFDGDGRLDIFFPGGGYYKDKTVLGHPCRLYRNLGKWKFQDVTKEVGLNGPWQYAHGAAAFDYDNDGWTDLLVTGYNRLVLLHNESDGKGGRKFADVTKNAKIDDNLWSTSAAWGDLDGDGYADLYVAHYGDWGFNTNHPTDCTYDGKTRDVCQPRKFKPLPHTVYRNNRDGTFTDVTGTLKLRKDGKGIGVLIADYNQDGKPDIYAANDTDDNFLYLNRTTPRGSVALEEVGLLANVARDDRGTANGSMGLDAADYDHTGRPSIIVTNYENELPALYQNKIESGKRERFNYATTIAGLGAIGGRFVSWGAGFLDLDNDGWDDLAIVSGHAIRYPSAKYGRKQRPMLARNTNGRFTPIPDEGGSYFQAQHNARGLALGDLDNDGKTDMVVSHLNEPVVVLRNVAPAGAHWIGFELVGKSNRDTVGARVVVERGSGTLTRVVKGGGSYASTSDRRLLFGLGADDKVLKVTVYWPWGGVQTWENVPAGRYWKLTEGEAKIQPATGGDM
jgi:hypothetical protein